MIINKEVAILNYMNPYCRVASDPKFLCLPLNNVFSTKKKVSELFSFFLITEGKKTKLWNPFLFLSTMWKLCVKEK